MQSEQETVEVEDSISTEDTTPEGNLSSDDLLTFIEGEPEEKAQPEPVAQAEVEAETEEGSEDDVLLQSELEEELEDNQEGDEDPEESEPPKSVQKLLRQIGKLTARAKTAEENHANLESQLQDLQKQSPEAEQKNLEINKVETFDELEKLRQEALGAKKWARKHEGESFVEENGSEFTADQIREIRDNAEDYIDELIPERAKFLTEKHQSNQLATDTFAFVSDKEHPAHDLLQKVMQDEKFAILDSMPNALYLKSLIVEGAQVVKARNEKPAKANRKAKPSPPSAPVSDVSPPTQTVKKTDRKILGTENVSEDQLVAFLSQ